MSNLRDLDEWHSRYNRAIANGRDPAEAVIEADLTPEMVAEAERKKEYQDAICFLIPLSTPVARSYDPGRPPDVMEYKEVWLTPHELRRVAARKLAGEQL